MSTPFTASAIHGRRPLPAVDRDAATWDPTAATDGGAITANALKATGWVWDFAPVQDLARDNRWGRTYETWAEQPALSGAIGAANVQGLQSSGAVTATVKHFAGYSQSVNGHDTTPYDVAQSAAFSIQ